MLKKVFSIIAACAVCVSLSVSAFAIEMGDAFDLEVENPEKVVNRQEEFTIGGTTYNDYLNYMPVGTKIALNCYAVAPKPAASASN